jgi:hypothetical protein
MRDYSSATVCVVDNGLSVELARRLACDFGRVYYYTPWETFAPTSNRYRIGTGFPEIFKVDSIWTIISRVDLWVFPDVNNGPLQVYLESIGERVWGSRMGEELELDRSYSKNVMEEVGVIIGPYQVIRGLPALRDYLRFNNDQWVKISRTRGDTETFHSQTYELVEPQLDQLEHNLGALKHDMEFVVEQGIPDAIEIGYDGYCVDGVFPSKVMAGIEIKDKSYVGRVRAAADLPKPLQDVNFALVDVLRNYQYRNFFSSEVRVTRDGKAFLIDPCCRIPCPPGELSMEMYTNLADILWNGAEGIIVDPVPQAEWGAELVLKSSWADTEWAPVIIPPEIRSNVKLFFPAVLDGKTYVIPQRIGMQEIGAVVATGSTMEEAIVIVKMIAEAVQGFGLQIPTASLDDANAAVAALAEYGMTL